MKKKVNWPLIAIAVIIVAVIAVIAVIAVKAKSGQAEKIDTAISATASKVEETVLSVLEEVTTGIFEEETSLESKPVSTTGVSGSVTEKNAVAATSKATTTAPAKEVTTESLSQIQEEMTVPELDEDEMKTGKGSVASASSANDLPLDMSFSGLYKQGYDTFGLKEYIYNNDTDPNCAQRKYGYNSFYDSAASLIDFTIDTKKMKFNYDGKTYRIQLWKGQYISGDIGTVGGEVGIYTRDGENSNADHFNCADESDELYQELTILWNEAGDGVYKAQLTRNYAKHWWCTGYVDGQLANKRDSSTLRLLSRMTFKDEEQATAFAASLGNQGFTLVETFNPTVPNTYKQYGKDVIYIWQ